MTGPTFIMKVDQVVAQVLLPTNPCSISGRKTEETPLQHDDKDCFDPQMKMTRTKTRYPEV